MERFNLSAAAVRNSALTLFALLLVLALGATAWQRLGRAEDPAFTLKVMVVSAQWPGATAEQMQRLVADPIEARLQDLPNLDILQTFARPGTATIQVTLRDTTPPREVAGLWYQVRKKVGDIAGNLPSGLRGPYFDDEYGDVFSALFALTGSDNADLVRQAERIQARLRRIPGVGKVSIEGERPQRIHVEVSHARLATLGVQPAQIVEALQRFNPVIAAGVVEGGASRLFLRPGDGFGGLQAIRDLPIAVGGRNLRLSDIATVERALEDPPTRAIRQDGVPAVIIAVAKQPGFDVLALGAALRTEAAAIRADLPLGIGLAAVNDQSAVVAESIAEFLLKFAVAIGVVLLVSFAALGFGAGIVVALAVPLTLSLTMALMWRWGMELDRISLGALILSLGLLVDDAIIAIEAMVVKLEQGWDRARAAGFAWTSTAGPMLTGTLVTIAGFIPVGFAASSAGEYAGGIFWVVGAALIASWLVAVTFTPWLGIRLLPKPSAHHADPYAGRFFHHFRRLVGWVLDHRLLVLGATLLALAGGGVLMGMVRQQFFPVSERRELLVDVTLRQGAPFAATDAAIARIEAELRNDPDATLFTAYLGAGAPRFFLALNPDLPNEAFGKIVVLTPDVPARERLRTRLLALAEAGIAPEARIRVSRLDFGPPVGFPVQVRVTGPDPAELRRAADQVLAVLREVPGAAHAELAWSERMPSLRLELDSARVAQLGLSPAEVSQALATLLSGTTATSLREGNRRVDVILRAPAAERLDPGSLPDLTLSTSAGAVPLAQIARLVPEAEEPILWRRNREGFLTVRADVQPGFQPLDVSNAAMAALAPIVAGLPAGYRLEPGGAAEESAKANASLAALFPVMGGVMLLLLMIQLRHWGDMAVVVATAPLGLPGAAAALLVMGQPFGFVALLGVIALAGMIMRNTLILVDQVRQDLAAGAERRTAIIESTVRRARPVVLTGLAAVLAFIPLTSSAFWGPMAVAMIGGLLFATVATLVVVPAVAGLALGRRGRAVVRGGAAPAGTAAAPAE
ncbi:multidrug efflux pump subunit AcrB [Humitalea rosea]|uniref:Multidrug efflux pump subunit AcrB n=1 Tax=Humitalea rosea TaxID=990373 RepID=A0A2W7IGM3_9PROT|nr:efflux RND transporter permease subunit [Humitalea rosea]PZW45911.1 multidrug efflux pump subunit AcrB [Humitalea rosea]